MTNHEAVESILSTYWEDECDTVGSEYVRYIVHNTLTQAIPADQLFVKSKGKHAFGMAEAIDILLKAAALIVSGLKLAIDLREKKKKNYAALERVLIDRKLAVPRDNQTQIDRA